MLPLKIAISGAGWVTEHHLRAYRELGDAVEVIAIADPDPQVLAERADRWGIPNRYESDAEMLAEMPVDALDVANPREHHASSVARAARQGIAVLCQKPLAPTYQEARALCDGLPPGTRLMVNENWRHRPHYGRIRDWVADGRLGPIRQALLLARTSGLLRRDGGALPALERQPMLAGLDRMLLMEVLIHHVDALRSVLGDMDLLASVMGSDSEELLGEDRVSLLLDTNGAAVSVIGDFRSHGAPPGLTDELHIQGVAGAIVLNGDSLRLLSQGEIAEDLTVDLASDYAASYRGMIAQFVEAARVGDPRAFEAQVKDNLKTLYLVEQAYALARRPEPPAPVA